MVKLLEKYSSVVVSINLNLSQKVVFHKNSIHKVPNDLIIATNLPQKMFLCENFIFDYIYF